MMKKCAIEECQNPSRDGRFCNAHAHRKQRYGDPRAGRRYHWQSLVWLEAHTEHAGAACLTYEGLRGADGYGRVVRRDGKSVSAHRWMCEAVHGKPPRGKPYALHRCGKGHLGCVNPNHLYWGSAKDNGVDRVRHGTQARGERVGTSKLNAGAVAEIKARLIEGATITEIAPDYGVTIQCIWLIQRGVNWAWVSPAGSRDDAREAAEKFFTRAADGSKAEAKGETEAGDDV